MSVRVHIGVGAVYLRGWFNIDVKAEKTFLAHDRPDLVERWATTDENYYAKHGDKTIETLAPGPLDQEYVCDEYGDFLNLPVAVGAASEVLARHAFEHLSIREARAALEMMDTIMKPGAILRLDVPDHEETLRLWHETGNQFYVRHLLGPRRDERGFHMMSYTRESLRKLVEEHGFTFQYEEPNIHFYPAFCLRFIKSTLPPPKFYARPPYEIEADWKVLEIGPGNYPLERADCYVDQDVKHLKKLALRKGQSVLVADLMGGLPQISNKFFDYVFCSHVLEHVDDPIAAAETLSRVAKRGTVVFPSAVKESMFNFEEPEHKWLILPNPDEGDPPIFIRKNGHYAGVIDVEVQRAMCRLFRTGPNYHPEANMLRNWYAKVEPQLDIILHWERTLQLMVIG